MDGFVRVLGADYSVPPTFVGRRIGIRVGREFVRLTSEGGEIATHRRSFVPADVVLAPAHGRAIRLAREARDRLVAGDVELPEVSSTRAELVQEFCRRFGLAQLVAAVDGWRPNHPKKAQLRARAAAIGVAPNDVLTASGRSPSRRTASPGLETRRVRPVDRREVGFVLTPDPT